MVTTTPTTAAVDLQQLYSATNEVRALLQTITELEPLPTGLRIDALRELSNAAEDLAWKLVQAAANPPAAST